MRWRPRRRAKAPVLTADQWLNGIQRAISGSTVHHEHVVKHEPVPPPVGGEVVIKRLDGSDAWRGRITPGRGSLTMLQVPLANIDKRFRVSDAMTFEFRWER